ncbi:hypothetical protein TNCV_1163891 [Trichonephila clavipes]|nr:hypothetical protein TNCV_1163891 [Trichonephila clavipes]
MEHLCDIYWMKFGTSDKEIDQSRDINHDNESKFEKSDEHMKRLSRKDNFQMLPKKKVHPKRYETGRPIPSAPCQRDTRMEKFNMIFVDHQRKVILQ